MKQTLRAFRNRNYRLYFAGQGISQIGTWMQRTAVVWVIYTMKPTYTMLGLAAFASQFPSFLFSVFGGIVSDRYNRYKVLLFTQAASMVQAILLAVLAFTKNYTIWELLTLSVVLGIINAFDMPARQPMIHEMVNDKADLPNALAFNSSMVNIARLIGPALSGIVLVKFGAGICFSLNALSFVAVLGSLLLMKMPPYVPSTEKKKITSDLVEGFTYLRKTSSLGIIMLLFASVSLLVLPYNTLLPAFAKDVFKGDAATFGYINSFIGLGSLAGAVFLASLKPGTDLKFVLLANSIILGISLMFFSHFSYFPLAMLFATLTGFGAMSQTTICLTIIQVDTQKSMRGRVMSYVAMSYFGMLPLGALLVGTISEEIGATNAILGQGVLALVIAIAFSRFLRSDRLKKRNLEQLEEAEEVIIEKM